MNLFPIQELIGLITTIQKRMTKLVNLLSLKSNTRNQQKKGMFFTNYKSFTAMDNVYTVKYDRLSATTQINTALKYPFAENNLISAARE